MKAGICKGAAICAGALSGIFLWLDRKMPRNLGNAPKTAPLLARSSPSALKDGEGAERLRQAAKKSCIPSPFKIGAEICRACCGVLLLAGKRRQKKEAEERKGSRLKSFFAVSKTGFRSFFSLFQRIEPFLALRKQ